MDPFEYITSELFIHDDIVATARGCLDVIYSSWKEKGHIDNFLISWPEEHLLSDDGKIITGPVLLDLPKDRKDWTLLISRAVKKTRPYALLLGEQRDDEVRAVLESKHGTVSWHFPIKDHGGTRVLGDHEEKKNKVSLGILWRPASR